MDVGSDGLVENDVVLNVLSERARTVAFELGI